MSNPIEGLLEIPQHVKDWVASMIAAAEARLQAEIQKAEVRGEIKGLQLLDYTGGLAAGAAHNAIQAKIDELTKLL